MNCLFPLDAYMVSCPTRSKNLERTLLQLPPPVGGYQTKEFPRSFVKWFEGIKIRFSRTFAMQSHNHYVLSRLVHQNFLHSCNAALLHYVQVVLCQINIFCHQNTTAYFCQIFEYLHKLFWNSKHKFCKFWILEQFVQIFVNLTKSVVIFWVSWWKNMLIWQRITCTVAD